MYNGMPYGLQPNVAAEAAAQSVMNNVTSGIWENASKEEQQRQANMEAYAKEVWKNPNVYQTVPVQQSGGSSVPTTTTTNSGGSSSSGHKCRLCGGSGRKVRESWVGDKTSTKWCNECNKSVGMGHSHTQCDMCGGDGWVD